MDTSMGLLRERMQQLLASVGRGSRSVEDHHDAGIPLHRRHKQGETALSVLQLWRRDSIPEWQGKLDKIIQTGDHAQEDYARWMLREILLDIEYKEPAP